MEVFVMKNMIITFCRILIVIIIHQTITESTLTCNASAVVVVEDGPVAIVCEECKPGYEVSQPCRRALLLHIHHEVDRSMVNKQFSSHVVRQSLCRRCKRGTFSDENDVNQTCRPCTYCPKRSVVIRNCNYETDTVCADPRDVNMMNLTSSSTSSGSVLLQTSTNPTSPPKDSRNVDPPISEQKMSTTIIGLILGFLFLTLITLAGCTRRAQLRNKKLVTRLGMAFSETEDVKRKGSLTMEFEDSYEVAQDSNCKANFASPKSKDEKFNFNFLEASAIDNGLDIAILPRRYHSYSLSHLDERSAPPVKYECIPQTEVCVLNLPPLGISSNQISYHSSVTSSVCPLQRLDSLASTRHGSFADSASDQLGRITVEASKVFGSEGGRLQIEGTSVSLKVPRGAIPDGERKDIDVKIHICRPNDWELLRENGYTIELPQIELGPSGSKFLKPIEVIMKNLPSDKRDETVFEFTENSVLSEDTIWNPATKCKSRNEAKRNAQKQTPNVAFFAGDENLHVFYLHFTGGRKKVNKFDYKWLQAKAFLKIDAALGDIIALKVIFFEATPEGKLMLEKETDGLKEVSVFQKSLKIFDNENSVVEAKIKNFSNDWSLEQGEDKQHCSFASIFDPKYLGNLPVVDFILQSQVDQLANFSCTIDVLQMGKKEIDLKIAVSKDFLVGKLALFRCTSRSSGYCSIKSCKDGEHFIDDSKFKAAEPREYLRRVFIQLSEHLAGVYKMFARNLGVSDCVIATASLDNPTNAKEACYTLLKDWLNAQSDGPNFKIAVLQKIQKAVDATESCCTIILPDFSQMKVVSRETAV